MKKVLLGIATLLCIIMASMTAFAAGNATSEYWYQEGTNWKIKDGSGNMIKDSWVCDDKNNQNKDSNWYLMDSNGVMYEGVINDNGHYYLLDPNHNGTYGMMISGTATYSYNGVQLQLETQHNGFFGEIKNTDAIANLGLKVTNVNTAGKAFLYTSNFGGSAAKTSEEANEDEDSDTTTTKANPDTTYRYHISFKDTFAEFRTIEQKGDNTFILLDLGEGFLYYQDKAGNQYTAGSELVLSEDQHENKRYLIPIFEDTGVTKIHYFVYERKNRIYPYAVQEVEENQYVLDTPNIDSSGYKYWCGYSNKYDYNSTMYTTQVVRDESSDQPNKNDICISFNVK